MFMEDMLLSLKAYFPIEESVFGNTTFNPVLTLLPIDWKA